MTSPIRISATLLTLVAAWFGAASCSNSNPPSITYTQESSINKGNGLDTGDSGTDGGSTVACLDDLDAGPRPQYSCSPNWRCTHPIASITQAGDSVGKGISCVAADQQVGYKTCGPANAGFKSETCQGGAYVEQADCSFDPACDFSCFKLPDPADPAIAACPATAPSHGGPCTMPACVVCGGTSAGQTTGYLDSKRSAKIGFCVCLPPTASSTQKWSCATGGTIWPCPGGKGC
jgi:hypothetical protein